MSIVCHSVWAIGSWAATRGADLMLKKWMNPTVYPQRSCLRHAPLCMTIVNVFVCATVRCFTAYGMLSITGPAPGEGKWKSCFFVTLSPPASATLCPWKHNEIFKCSTTWYIHFMLSVLHLLSTAAKVSMRGVVGPSLVKDVLSKLLGWNLPWFIKWSTTAMPSPLIQMLQTHTNAHKRGTDGPAGGGCQEGHRSLEYSTVTFNFTLW